LEVKEDILLGVWPTLKIPRFVGLSPIFWSGNLLGGWEKKCPGCKPLEERNLGGWGQKIPVVEQFTGV